MSPLTQHVLEGKELPSTVVIYGKNSVIPDWPLCRNVRLCRGKGGLGGGGGVFSVSNFQVLLGGGGEP